MVLPWSMAAGINEQPKRAQAGEGLGERVVQGGVTIPPGWQEKEFKQWVLYG
jgi:hypothetical protein